MNTFKPFFDSLPPEQQALWPLLSPAAELGFVLYGGTSLALRLGHRLSIDFDFFSKDSFDKDLIMRRFDFMKNATILFEKSDNLTISVPIGNDRVEVKVSFFGGINFGRVGEPSLTEDGVMLVASLDDIFATKLKVILQRAEFKDYYDISTMLSNGYNLSDGLANASLLFAPTFQPSVCARALTFYDDGDLINLSACDKAILCEAVQKLGKISPAIRLSDSLLPASSVLEWRAAKAACLPRKE